MSLDAKWFMIVNNYWTPKGRADDRVKQVSCGWGAISRKRVEIFLWHTTTAVELKGAAGNISNG